MAVDELRRSDRGETGLSELIATRIEANGHFFDAEAERLAHCCHRMAERFARGGRLIAFGRSPSARSDVRHVAVEFVHPVIVGKRALPAIGLTGEGGPLPTQVELLVEKDDVTIAFGAEDPEVREETKAAVATARARGCMSIAFAPAGAEWEFEPPTSDPYVRQELTETLYHVLWELVHVFFDQRGLLAGRETRQVHDAGASSFLYPFLDEDQTDLDGVIENVRASILMKAAEVAQLREQTLVENRGELEAAAAIVKERLGAGGKLLAFGNGGSATDATDLVADLRAPAAQCHGAAAIDLTEDPSILTAIANDVGVEQIFQRQIIAYGCAGDVAVALSTSGNSRNLIVALVEARQRGLVTIAFVGYDGGRIAGERLADHVIVTRSENIPRIQEAQASAYHVLLDLLAPTAREAQ
jgi:D-sedoheptulose 7-phosphate isomerase